MRICREITTYHIIVLLSIIGMAIISIIVFCSMFVSVKYLNYVKI